MHDRAILFHFGALGDVLISLPCIRFLKAIGYSVTLVASFPQALLLKELDEVDDVINASSSVLSDIYVNPKKSDILSSYSEVFIFSKSFEPELFKILKANNIVVRLIHTYPFKRVSNYKYQLTQLIEALSINLDKIDDLSTYFKPFNLSSDILEKDITISVHLGSGSEVKNLPLFTILKYIKEINRLYNPRWLFITGPAEAPQRKLFVEDLVFKLKDRAFHLDSYPLLSVANYIKSSSLFIGNDSGISHLAAFCGTKSILCFGPTDPKIWAPPFSWIKTIVSKKSCAPCNDYHKCQTKDCMKFIEIGDLILVTHNILG